MGMMTVARPMACHGDKQRTGEVAVSEIDLTPSYQDALRLAQLRKQAKRFGLKLSKLRWHQPYVRNRGGLLLLDSQNEVVAGAGYSLDLASVARILFVMADQMPPSMLRPSKHPKSRTSRSDWLRHPA